MQPSYRIPARFDPASSLLGLGLRRLCRDRRRADGAYYVAAALLVVALLLAHHLAWASGVGPSPLASPAALRAADVLVVLFAFVGIRPAVTVTPGKRGLRIRQGRRTVDVGYADVRSVRTVSALRFHRHYGRYAATQAFVNHAEPELLLLTTDAGPVVLGLGAADRAALADRLHARARLDPCPSTVS